MTAFSKNIQFKYPWRDYQKRVLDELEEHLDDNKLHVIAPPGSGKTVLGLEVMLRINQPTLILAPTIAIKNQWVRRFCELFLQSTKTPNWISTDIHNPKLLTVSTYQALHTAYAKETENEINTTEFGIPIFISFKEKGIKTIIADEAHHLKKSWWHTLNELKKELSPFIIGLTATPPYDVSFSEWQRYLNFNGPIDAEISTPELVAVRDLCPHQDYVYLTFPSQSEYEYILEYRRKVEFYFNKIKNDTVLLESISKHPIISNPLENLDYIYSNFEDYASSLIFLHSNGIEISQTHHEIIGGGEIEVPNFDFEWAGKLLDFYINRKDAFFKKQSLHQKELKNELKLNGILQGKKINFFYNAEINQSLEKSLRKLNGIVEIIKFEHEQLSNKLRLVVLSDYILKEYMVNTEINDLKLDKFGVIPIFEKIRRAKLNELKIGVLTGSLVIIPKSALSFFKSSLSTHEIDEARISELPYDKDYILIHQTASIKKHIVHVVTKTFERGAIQVLIGTKSLLGEGWDCPAINSLILASFIGSFVSSNQMRGRAIRTQMGNKNKTANIWHLACIDPTVKGGGSDIELLNRRFKTFAGIPIHGEEGIENGINRLKLLEDYLSENDAKKLNMSMFEAAKERGKLKQRWEAAIQLGNHMTREIKTPSPSERNIRQKQYYYSIHTVAYAIGLLFSSMGYFLLDNLLNIWSTINDNPNPEILIELLSMLCIAFIIGFGGMTWRTMKLWIHYRDISKDVNNIGRSLLIALSNTGEIHTPISRLKVISHAENNGAIFCHLEGGKSYEKTIFIEALAEILGPVENPRYIIVRKSRFFHVIKQRDYHAVPDLLGKNKAYANLFADLWKSITGDCELIFTKTVEGRKLLLKARIQSLSAQFEKPIEQIQKWR